MRVGIFGAGAVGGYLGVRLSAVGVPVVLLGRRSLVEVADQLAALPIGGRTVRPSPGMRVSDDPSALGEMDVCLVTVKSGDTEAAAAVLARVLRADAVVVSFQNGLHNAEILRRHLGERVVQGVVSFNVFRDDQHRIHQATAGKLYAGTLPPPALEPLETLKQAFARAGDPLLLRADIADIAAGKLLLNLNNGVCAATGLSIAESLRSRDARWCFSQCILEGLSVMRASGLRPKSVIGLPPGVIARVLELPNWLVLRAARAMASVDPSARSSTLQDLDRGRATEIDELNGAIVSLAGGLDTGAPVNAAVLAVVREHERRVAVGDRPHFLSAAELRARIIGSSRRARS